MLFNLYIRILLQYTTFFIKQFAVGGTVLRKLCISTEINFSLCYFRLAHHTITHQLNDTIKS